MAFLVDTNIFIDSKNRMPFDLWPTFWSRIAELIDHGEIFTIDKVKDEIDRGKDDLTNWLKNNTPRSFFLSIDNDDIVKYKEIVDWAKKEGYKDAIKNFAIVADSFLIAKALTKDFTIVTYEKSDPIQRKKVKIPDVCKAFNVKYCDLNDLLREVGVTI